MWFQKKTFLRKSLRRERNKKDVTGIAGGLLAAACALAGGASTQVAGMGGVKSGQALMDGVSDIEVEENHFTQLKNAICRIITVGDSPPKPSF